MNRKYNILQFIIIALLVFKVYPGLQAQYCIPTSTSGPTYNTLVNGVTLGDIHNRYSGDPAGPSYTFYEDLSTTLHRGSSYDLLLDRGSYYSAMYYYAWIDYNQDGDFIDAGELVGSFLANSTDTWYHIYFTAPANAVAGWTRMRVSCAYSVSDLGPCDAYTYGETEDYPVRISDFIATSFDVPIGEAVCVADLDGDRDEDLIVSGEAALGSATFMTSVYQNNGSGTFSSVEELYHLNRLYNPEIFPGDFDNDNDMDFILSGHYDIAGVTTNTSILYQNNGISSFSSVSAGVFPLNLEGKWAWGDYDNDGDLDLFYMGEDTDYAKLFRNHKGVFTEISTSIGCLRLGDARWQDYDNDGDLDLVISGQDSINNKYTRIYKNNNLELDLLNLDLPGGFYKTSTAWTDFDSDGDLDILINGSNNTYIYLNDGNDNFRNISHNLPRLNGTMKWGDYDLDGMPDILFSGSIMIPDGEYYTTEALTAVYVNQGGNQFEQLKLPIDYTGTKGADWIDYDRDGDLDVVQHYISNNTSRIYENTSSIPINSAPAVPIGLYTEQVGTSLILRWTASADDISDLATLQYNVRFGHYPYSQYLLPPMAHYYYGNQFIRKEGNALFNTEKEIRNVPPRGYYWSVQALDGSGRASSFASSSYVNMLPFLSQVYLYEDPGQLDAPACWGDFNDDGYLDVFSENKLYRNNGGTSFILHDSLEGPGDISCAEWLDYNNDGDLDLIYCGQSYDEWGMSVESSEFCVYENNNGSFTRNTDVPFETVGRGNFIWKDFNGDGLKDIVYTGLTISGGEYSDRITRLYLNNGNRFTAGSFPVSSASAFYSTDLDADQDFDILLNNGVKLINDGDANFSVDATHEFINGTYAFSDYDGDGDIDVLAAGTDALSNKKTILYRNNEGSFENTLASLPGLTSANLNWLDTDGDRDFDVFITGSAGTTKTYHIENMGDGEYQSNLVSDLPLNSYMATVQLGDYDNDGDPDVLVSGDLEGSSSLAVYRNNYNETGIASGSPENPQSELDGFDVVLSWEPPYIYKEGDPIGYSYELMVGTAPDNFEVIAPESDPVTGFIRTMHLGNACANREFRLRNLPVGTYYWAVQAINPGYQASNWTTVQSFTITEVSPEFDFDTACMGIATTFTDSSVTSDVIDRWNWDFGDGGQSNSQHPSHIYTSGGTYNVTLWAFTQSGDSSSISHDVLVYQAPEALYSTQPVCDREDMVFTDNSSVGGLTGISYLWNFGDGESSGTLGSVSHRYASPGIYSTSLTISADNGCSDVLVQDALVAAYPEASVSLAPGYNSTFCSDDSTILVVLNQDGYAYQWQLNGGNMFGETDTSLLVKNQSGDYSIVIENPEAGCISTDMMEVRVIDAPSPPSIIDPGSTEFCEGEGVELSVSDNPEYTYYWKLNGGAVGGNSNSHMATAPGTYSLEVENSSGCLSVSANYKVVTENPLPDIPSDVSVVGSTTFCEGESVELSVSDNPGYTYYWKLNGGAVGGNSNSYVADATGDYMVSVSSSHGCISETEFIHVQANPLPSSPAIMLVGSTIFCEGNSVELSVSDDPDLDYQWLLGEAGSVGTNTNTYTAFASGDYSLRVSNEFNCTALSSSPISVSVLENPEIPTLTVSGQTSFCEGGSVNLGVDFATGMDYQWMNGTSTVGGASSNSYTATTDGNYHLEISNSNGCTSQTEPELVTVYPAPDAPTITYSGDLEFCDNDSLMIQVPSHPDFIFQWLRDGVTPVGTLSNYVIRESGEYSVRVSNPGGCSVLSSNPVSVVVHESPAAPSLVYGETTFCEGGSVTLNVSDPGTDSYQWFSVLGAVSGETGTGFTTGEAGTYRVRVRTSELCDAFSQEIPVRVNAYPEVPVVLTENYEEGGCQDEDPVILSVETTEANTTYQWMRNNKAIDGATGESYSAFLDEVDYSVMANSNGCGIASELLSIDYGEMPDKPEIFAEGPVVWYLACSNDSASAYRWYRNGERIVGVDDYIYVAGSQMGRYEVAISMSGSCFATSDAMQIPLGTGMHQDIWENLNIYPNPTPGLFTLEMDNAVMGDLIIDIFGESGTQIINIKFLKETTHFKTEIDLSAQPAGLYLIGLLLEEYKTNRKLIVE